MENAVNQATVNLKEEVGRLDRCHHAPTADCCSRDYLLPSVSVMGSRVENRRSGFSLPVAVGALSRDPPQSGLA